MGCSMQPIFLPFAPKQLRRLCDLYFQVGLRFQFRRENRYQGLYLSKPLVAAQP
jgi:hypothetical protein